MGIRQKPITTEDEFLKACQIAKEWESTIFVQFRDPELLGNDIYYPEVVLAENYIWYFNNPNDIWKDFEDHSVRAWWWFPNIDERNMSWENS